MRAAIETLRADGLDVVGAVLLGGTEKLAADEAPAYGVPEVVTSTGDPLAALVTAMEKFGPDLVIDLSGDPVIDARVRMRLVAHALVRGIRYQGADFLFEPPPRPRVAVKPSVAVVATAKRSGKTALAGHLARLLARQGRPPVVVAMGRGGPEEPELIEIGGDLGTDALLTLARSGRHAASDHLEDALMAGVATIGTRRTGSGMAGATAHSTFERGVAMANGRPESILILEGSGSAIPPAHADATICAVPADADPELVTGYLGAYVLLLADLVIVTLADEPLARAAHALEDRIRELVPGTPIVRNTFRPHPLEPIAGLNVFFATTAPPPVAATLAAYMETEHGARVVGWSANLANRKLLTEDLQAAEGAEVLVTELKAAAVDVAAQAAMEAGMDVVFCDNRVVSLEGDRALDAHLAAVVDLAVERYAVNHPE